MCTCWFFCSWRERSSFVREANCILQIHVPKETVNVLSSDRKSVIPQKYPKCFQGIGKLNNFQLKIPIGEHVRPVVQLIRRIPYHLREKLEKKLRELEQYDIIEKVDGPSKWVSPVVVIPKKNDDIRLCINMRRANEAVIREGYCIPTVDEILQELNQSKVYSKLDIKWAYHQHELLAESRKITTFMTHQGHYLV